MSSGVMLKWTWRLPLKCWPDHLPGLRNTMTFSYAQLQTPGYCLLDYIPLLREQIGTSVEYAATTILNAGLSFPLRTYGECHQWPRQGITGHFQLYPHFLFLPRPIASVGLSAPITSSESWLSFPLGTITHTQHFIRVPWVMRKAKRRWVTLATGGRPGTGTCWATLLPCPIHRKQSLAGGRAAHQDDTGLPENTDLRVESHWRASGWGWRLRRTNPVGTQWGPRSQMKEDGDGHMVPKEITTSVCI